MTFGNGLRRLSLCGTFRVETALVVSRFRQVDDVLDSVALVLSSDAGTVATATDLVDDCLVGFVVDPLTDVTAIRRDEAQNKQVNLSPRTESSIGAVHRRRFVARRGRNGRGLVIVLVQCDEETLDRFTGFKVGDERGGEYSRIAGRPVAVCGWMVVVVGCHNQRDIFAIFR